MLENIPGKEYIKAKHIFLFSETSNGKLYNNFVQEYAKVVPCGKLTLYNLH